MARLVLLALLLTSCATAPAETKLDALLKGFESQGFAGTVLVAKNGRIVHHAGYGFADRALRIRTDTKTLYEVGSLEKTFTAAAILKLESEGALNTTDPLSRHLGEFPPPKDTATIHHLATHTAGLVPEGSDLGSGATRDDFIANVKRVPAESVPGERARYTNAGYSVLAAIIEKVSGRPFESYVRTLWDGEMYFRGDWAIPRRRFARGYSGADATETIPPPRTWGTRGAGGIITTVAELYRWHQALHANPVMKKMFEDRPEEEGFAWHVERDDAGRLRIHKGGGMPQYATQVIHYPDERVVIIWATNSLEKRWRQDLNREIAAIVLGAGAGGR